MVDSAAPKSLVACVTHYFNIESLLLRAAIGALLLTVTSCGGGGGSEEPPPPTGLQPTLASIQANVFTPSCAKSGCHIGGGAQAGLHLDAAGTSWNNLVSVMSSQNSSLTRVIPMDPDGSFLIHKLEGMGPNNTPLAVGMQMPADGPPFLQNSTIQVVRQWIQNGAQP